MDIQNLYELFIASTGISTDSRNVGKGTIFFALKGDTFDGNKYAHDALLKGASWAIIDNPEYHKDHRFIVVSDVLHTLQKLANFHRCKLKIPIVAITGTNGKTTTKELLKTVIAAKFKVVATSGNLNNHIGVPLTLLSMDNTTEFGIVEMGANHVGEIEQLCKIAEPDYGLITNIGKAHLDGFGSFEGIVSAKTELYRFLDNTGGTIIYNADNEILANKVRNYNCDKISYGKDYTTQCCGNPLPTSTYLEFVIKKPDYSNFCILTSLVGDFNFENALAACCIGFQFDIKFEYIKKAIETYQPSNNRSELRKLGSNFVICDYYNANPTSMALALSNFKSLDSQGMEKVVMLGAMKELGKYSSEEHQKIISSTMEMNFDATFFVGDEFEAFVNENTNTRYFKNSDALKNYIHSNNINNSFILVKGSRGSKMENILDVI